MIIVLGLGNPGSAYAGSRHNIGYRCVDILSKQYGIPLDQRRRHAVLGEGAMEGESVVLARSRTYMNLSGIAARYLLDRYRLPPSNLLAIYDERDLPVGQIRIRPRGSSAGHNGANSIIDKLESSDFPRLRIGIGQPVQQDPVDFVLGRFTPQESEIIEETLTRAAEAVACIVRCGIEAAMNKFNQRVQGAAEHADIDEA